MGGHNSYPPPSKENRNMTTQFMQPYRFIGRHFSIILFSLGLKNRIALNVEVISSNEN